MVFVALLLGFASILGGIITNRFPHTMAGFESLSHEEQQSNKVKAFARIKRISFIINGCIIIIGGIVANLTGIEEIFGLSIIIPSGILVVMIAHQGYKLSNNKKSYFKLSKKNTYVLIFVILFPLAIIAFFSKENTVQVNNDNIKISGIYGVTISYGQIKSIDLINSLPAIKLRTNGFALGYTLIGYFNMKNTGMAKLFIHSPSPIIKIQTDSRLYFLNFKEANKTIQCYNEIVEEKQKSGIMTDTLAY